MKNTIKDYISKLKTEIDLDLSFYTHDPISGNVALHGATNKRPKAYAGDTPKCPWDSIPTEPVLKSGEAFLVKNDFPAIHDSSLDLKSDSTDLNELYKVSLARGGCYVAIYTHEHDKRWDQLSDSQKLDVINLWADSTLHLKENNEINFVQIFENIGPKNSMTHPHGQIYSLSEVPPKVDQELTNSYNFHKRTGANLFSQILETEISSKYRIVYENKSFIAFSPPGAEWPYQIRVLPKRHVLWIFELNNEERKDFAEIITKIRIGLTKLFNENYKPTIMMTLQQAPFDDKYNYKEIYGMRMEFYNTALSKVAEKLMYSVENSTGLKVYGSNAEDIAEELRLYIK